MPLLGKIATRTCIFVPCILTSPQVSLPLLGKSATWTRGLVFLILTSPQFQLPLLGKIATRSCKLVLYILTSPQVWLPLHPHKSAVSDAPLRQNCYPVLQTCSLYPYKSAGLAAPLRQKCHLHLRTCFLYPNKSAVLVAPLRQNATRTCADLFLLKQFKNKLIPLRENKSASPRASFVCENRGKTQHELDLYHKRKQVRKSAGVFRVRKQRGNAT